MTACSRPSGSRYSALPATRTLAPAAAAPAHRVGRDAAVDLDVDDVGQPGGVDHPADLGDLRLHRGEVALAAEPGVDGHHEHEVDEVEHVGDGARRRGRADGDGGGGPELADGAQRAVQVQAGLGVDDQPLAPGLDVAGGHDVRREHHQVGLERHRDVRCGRRR